MAKKKRTDKRGRTLRDNEVQRPNGRYEYRYIDSRGIGQALYSWRLVPSDKTPKGKRDKPCLRELEAQLLKEMEQKPVVKSTPTLNTLCAEYMHSRSEEWKQMNRNSDAYLYDTYVRKAVGAINIKKITSEDIEKFYEELVIRDRIVINVLESLDGLLQVLFSTAVKSEYITSDPSQRVLEKVMATFNWKKPRRHILTERQYSAFTRFILSEDNVMFAEWVPLLTAMVGSGCRTEELLALSWSDVDAENDILRIQHKIQYRDRNHVTSFKILPARFGGREVPLIHAVQDALCKERDRQLKLGVSGSEFEIDGKSGFVFMNHKGHVHTPLAVNLQLKKGNRSVQ